MKLKSLCVGQAMSESPPSRGAWIEIEALSDFAETVEVAPLAGGVD